MIKLKSGKQIDYNENFDVFFMNLLENIIDEAKKSTEMRETGYEPGDTKNEKMVRDIMDNCIFVTHQLFEIAKDDENLSKFIVTGFLFNSIMLTLTHSNLSENILEDIPDDDEGIIH